MRYISVTFTLSIFATAYLGDHIVFNSKYSSDPVFRAFADTTVHGAIGFWSALLFFSHGINTTSNHVWVFNVLFCTAVAALIDMDHFIVAKSFNLKDVAKVNRRGIFHNTSFFIVMTTILLISSHITRKTNVYLLSFMLLLAFTSHHFRDANRRGLWLYPYRHTQPFGKGLYVFLICVLPSVCAYIFFFTKPLVNHKLMHFSGIV